MFRFLESLKVHTSGIFFFWMGSCYINLTTFSFYVALNNFHQSLSVKRMSLRYNLFTVD